MGVRRLEKSGDLTGEYRGLAEAESHGCIIRQ